MDEAHLYSRRKATEILGFVLTDTDREWNAEVMHHLPVAYAMKGYSLTSDVLRKMCNDVKNACAKEGVNIVCECFDGQWNTLVVRDEDGNPLNRLELQKAVWKDVTKMRKAQHISALKQMFRITGCNTPSDVQSKACVTHENGISMSSTEQRLMDLKTWNARWLWQKKSPRTTESESEETNQPPQTLNTEAIPAEVLNDAAEDEQLHAALIDELSVEASGDLGTTCEGEEDVDEVSGQTESQNDKTHTTPRCDSSSANAQSPTSSSSMPHLHLSATECIGILYKYLHNHDLKNGTI